jgi:hypothetical protein
MFTNTSIFYIHGQVLRKSNILCDLCKRKTTNYPVNSQVRASKFIFFTRHINNNVFPQNLCADIKYLNVHVDIFQILL